MFYLRELLPYFDCAMLVGFSVVPRHFVYGLLLGQEMKVPLRSLSWHYEGPLQPGCFNCF